MKKVFYIITFSLFLLLNVFLIWVCADEYYEFFIKSCRDAFPFGYCPWGAESMGWGWRSANAYLAALIRHFIILCTFFILSVYNLHKKKYGLALLLMVLPVIIFLICNLIEYLLFY